MEGARVEGEGKSERGKKMADVEDKRKEKKRRRFRLGTMVLWEICKFKNATSFLLMKLPFVMWVREVIQEQWVDLRFQALALLTFQEVAEAYVVNLFEDADLCALHAKCGTLMPQDAQLAHESNIWSKLFGYSVQCRKEPYPRWQW